MANQARRSRNASQQKLRTAGNRLPTFRWRSRWCIPAAIALGAPACSGADEKSDWPAAVPEDDASGTLGGTWSSDVRFPGFAQQTSREISGIDDVSLVSLVEKANGAITFGPNCSAAERDKLNQAMAMVQSGLTSNDALLCMANGFLSYTNGMDPETLDFWLKFNVATEIDCGGAGAGQTLEGDVGALIRERFTVSHDTLTRRTEHVATTILHELTHTKGARHPSPSQSGFEHEFTIPYTAGSCIEGIALGDGFPFNPHSQPQGPNDRLVTRRNRALLPDESYTTNVGGKLSNSFLFDLRCEGFAEGIALGAPAPVPRGLAFDCNAGSPIFIGTFGANAAAAGCAAGEVLIGIAGTSPPNSLPQTVFGLCQPLASVQTGVIAPSRIISAFPTDGSMNYLRLCPAGMAINGLAGHVTSTNLGDFSVHCEAVNGFRTRAERRLTIRGVAQGNTSDGIIDLVRCAGRGALRGFLGMNTGGTIYGFGGVCANIESLADRGRVRTVPSLQFLEWYPAPPVGDHKADIRFGAVAVANSFTNPTQCNDDEALIGANFREQGRVSFIQGICSNAEQWTNVSQPTPILRALRGFGSTTGSILESRCSRGELLVGAEVNHSIRNSDGGRTIDTIRPICRDFRRR
jgi:hypothetical protein